MRLHEKSGAPTAPRGARCHLVEGTLRYRLLRWPTSGITVAKNLEVCRKSFCQRDLPLYAAGAHTGCHRGPQSPTQHHVRGMLRDCGTRPPPPHLGRTLRARQSAIRLPWLPLASDNSCTPPARRHCSSVKNTYTHTYASIR